MNFIKKALIFFVIWIVGFIALSMLVEDDPQPQTRIQDTSIVKRITSQVQERESAPPVSRQTDEKAQYASTAQVQVAGSPVIDVDVVEKEQDRRKGLSGKAFLPLDRGMLFVFHELGKHSFWMRNMNFAIDIIWIRNSEVVDIIENVPTESDGTPDEDLPIYKPDASANRVLEVTAGWVKTYGVKKGDTIVYNPNG